MISLEHERYLQHFSSLAEDFSVTWSDLINDGTDFPVKAADNISFSSNEREIVSQKPYSAKLPEKLIVTILFDFPNSN